MSNCTGDCYFMRSFRLCNLTKRHSWGRCCRSQRQVFYLVYSSERILQGKSENERLSYYFLLDLYRYNDVDCILQICKVCYYIQINDLHGFVLQHEDYMLVTHCYRVSQRLSLEISRYLQSYGTLWGDQRFLLQWTCWNLCDLIS